MPKARSGKPLPGKLGQFASTRTEDIEPDPAHAWQAWRLAKAGKLDLSVTAAGTLVGVVPEALFRQRFQTAFTPLHDAQFMAPVGQLAIPPDLATHIDYAYVPTPVDLHAESPVPPHHGAFHLRLDDIALLIGARMCHRQGWTGRGVTITTVDSGIARHPYLERSGYQIAREVAPEASQPAIDQEGHGTGVAAMALAIAPDAALTGIKFNEVGTSALEMAVGGPHQVINNSWGWSIDTKSRAELENEDPNRFQEMLDVERIIVGATTAGKIVVFSAGNKNNPDFPASHPDVIAVGGVTHQLNGEDIASDSAISFSSYLYPGRSVPDLSGYVGEAGEGFTRQKGHIMLPAPSGSLQENQRLAGSRHNLGWGVYSGTSLAAPQVSGAIALMLQVNPDLSPRDVKSILIATARDILTGQTAAGDSAGPGIDPATGAGVVDAFGACMRARQSSVA